MKKLELLDCPFCGKKPYLNHVSYNEPTAQYKWRRTHYKKRGYYINCCFGEFYSDPCGYDGSPESRTRLIEIHRLWNTRIKS